MLLMSLYCNVCLISTCTSVGVPYCCSVFDVGANNPGRGINVAVLNVDTMQVVKAVRFDTYQSSEGSLLLCHHHH